MGESMKPSKTPKYALTPSTRPQKRLKTNHSAAPGSDAREVFGPAQLDHHITRPTTLLTLQTILPSSDTIPPPEILPPALAHLQHKYALATMSFTSSSKINQKVRVLISHMEKFSFADLNAKPGVVVLQAKAPVAAKMVSVAEIAKREIEKEKGKWWQYSKVDGRLEELKGREKQKKDSGKGDGMTIKHWQEGQNRGANEGGDAMKDVMDGADAGLSSKVQNVASAEEDEDDEAFQTMNVGDTGKGAGAPEVLARSKVRAIPIMTIYMARVPVPELKELCG